MKKTRIVKGKEVEELEQPVVLKVITKCPEKWCLIDQETGQMYRGSKNSEIGKMWQLIVEKK